MYKTRNTGMGNGMQRTRGMGGMLYPGECCYTFRGMSSNIKGNIAKHYGECRQIFRGISSNIPGNVAKHSGECDQTFWGMSSRIPGKVRFAGYPKWFIVIRFKFTKIFELCLFVQVSNIIPLFFIAFSVSGVFCLICLTFKPWECWECCQCLV